MYHEGKGVTRDITTAIELYTEAASQGNKWAQYWLGDIYQFEYGFMDLQKAVNWFQKAADNNHDYAEEHVYGLNSRGYYAKEEMKGIINYFYFIYLKIVIKNESRSLS
jgi:TPR repeat protein